MDCQISNKEPPPRLLRDKKQLRCLVVAVLCYSLKTSSLDISILHMVLDSKISCIWILMAVWYSNLVALEVKCQRSYWSTSAALNKPAQRTKLPLHNSSNSKNVANKEEEEGQKSDKITNLFPLWKWPMLLIRKAGIEYLNWILKQLNTKYFISQLANSSIQSQFAQD